MVGSLPHDWNCFWPTLRWASFINDPAAGSLHQCHTPVEQISASDGPWGTIPGLRRISSGAVCLQPCCSSTHGTELGHFQNDHMLTKAAEATIRKDDIPFDLFHYSNSLNKISSAQISSRFLSPVNSFCHIRWTKLNVGMKTVPGKLLYVLSINVRIYIATRATLTSADLNRVKITSTGHTGSSFLLTRTHTQKRKTWGWHKYRDTGTQGQRQRDREY